MARVTKRNEHDWVMVQAKFEDGTEAKVKWNRGGSDVTVTPRDPAVAKTLSLIEVQALKLPGASIGKIADVMERVALASRTVGDYVEGLKTALNVSGELLKPAEGPSSAQVSLRKGRGWELAGVFPSGEKFELKINKSSIGLRSQPAIASRDADLMKVVFAIKGAEIMDDEELAGRMKDAAEGLADMDAWIEAVRGIMAPAPRR